MKKSFMVMLVLALVMCFTVSGDLFAQFGNKVADTPHNLREATDAGMPVEDLGEICVYCHTPHNNNQNIEAPLWNRESPAGPYDMYDSPTIDMTVAGNAAGVSLACLSCHDNTIGLDQVINIPTSQLGVVTPAGAKISSCVGTCHSGVGAGGLNFDGTNIGTDLTNDHPISITYDPGQDPNFHPASNGKVGVLTLYGPNKDQVECASCHNPHDNSNRPFLRMTNDNSAMCLTCHDI
ncbi:MAG: hypothetical protein DWQ05_05840 [Calditrichaeota bacterium]|nr:MAG: hypothetical protein DWQ05_05840 [Calditrichota bacterium]